MSKDVICEQNRASDRIMIRFGSPFFPFLACRARLGVDAFLSCQLSQREKKVPDRPLEVSISGLFSLNFQYWLRSRAVPERFVASPPSSLPHTHIVTQSHTESGTGLHTLSGGTRMTRPVGSECQVAILRQEWGGTHGPPCIFPIWTPGLHPIPSRIAE